MRIAHIEAGRHLYGGARQVLHLIDGLRDHGVENLLLCASGSAIASAARGLCEVVELPLRGELDIGAAGRLRRALARPTLRPDIVHVHSRRGADLYGGLASIGTTWRAVVSRRVDQREWAPAARLKYRPYAAVIAISAAVERELIEHVGLPRERVHRIPSGVPTETRRPPSRTSRPPDVAPRPSETQRPLRTERLPKTQCLPKTRRPSEAARSALGLPPDATIAAVIGQLIPRKGHFVLLDALPTVLERHPQWHVVFFGRGPLEAALRRAIERRGLAARVRIAGFRPDLAELLPGIDLVLHPALKEGLGLAVLEAMSAGVPVAASAAGGLLDVIEDGVSGLLLPPSDAAAWAAGIERLLANERERARLADAGRRRVREAFSASTMVLRHLALYRRLLGLAPDPERQALAPAAERDGASEPLA